MTWFMFLFDVACIRTDDSSHPSSLDKEAHTGVSGGSSLFFRFADYFGVHRAVRPGKRAADSEVRDTQLVSEHPAANESALVLYEGVVGLVVTVEIVRDDHGRLLGGSSAQKEFVGASSARCLHKVIGTAP